MSANDGSKDDIGKTLEVIRSSLPTSLASELQAIQRHAYPVKKDNEWAKKLLCLQYRKSAPGKLREFCNVNLKSWFVAVSYTWGASPELEDSTSGRYSITNTSSGIDRTCKVRNSILDRVVKYLDAVDIRTFWIDQECIDQDDQAVKAVAVNSMDLVYRAAKKSLGLLSTSILNRTRLRLVERLIEGRLAQRTDLNDCKFRTGVRFNTIVQVFEALRELTADQWWHRAWIFQEEFLSGMHMDLLIPIARGLQASSGEMSIPGELCVCAPRFREQATTFLLALLYKDGKKYLKYHQACADMLGTVGKYNILLQQNRAGPGSMSARICTDVIQRGITQPWDTLAIVANACSYKIRLDHHALVKENQSLSLSILAQFLLNGEIFVKTFDEDWDDDEMLDLDIGALLETGSLQNADVPVDSGKLTFLKNCRLPAVELRDEGILTVGYIWDLKNDERSKIRTLGLGFQRSSEDAAARPWETEELGALADLLQQHDHPALSERLLAYTRERQQRDKAGDGHPSNAITYMDLMASRLVQAIQSGHHLRVGYLTDGGGGIFVSRAKEDIAKRMQVLTTWQAGDSDEGELDNFTSLKVAATDDGSFALEAWMNGLVFFHGRSPEPVMIKWPEHWTSKHLPHNNLLLDP